METYVLVKRGEATVTADDVPEEGSLDGVYQLRNRWYRSTIPRGGAICSIHPDREATLQCIVCLRSKAAQPLSYHCSPDCLKTHWHLHKDYHKQALVNGGRVGCLVQLLQPGMACKLIQARILRCGDDALAPHSVDCRLSAVRR